MGFRIAVSGLRAASADLDVTGNNIANANTTGYKGSRVQFADVYAVSNLGSSSDAIGQGVQVAAVAQQFAQGNVSFTDNALDMAVNGEGFFVLDDNGSNIYTRAGAFGVDKDGYLVNPSGQQLVGFQAVAGTVTGALGPLRLDNANITPQASSLVSAAVNVDAADSVPAGVFDATDPLTYNNVASLAVYDSLGTEHLARVYFKKTASNAWETHLRVDGDNTQTTAVQNIAFDTSGGLTTAMPIGFGAYTPTNGAAPFTLSVNLTGTTQVGADFSINSLSQDGFTTGQLTGVDVDESGVVLARYSNGESQAKGQVALAAFANAQGLGPVSDTNWAESNASGPALISAPGSTNLGLLQAGALEESNTDLSTDLVNMIIAQRAFQANAQMIRAEDEVTQTIINIR